MKRIQRRSLSPIPASLADTFSPLLARVYAARQIASAEELNVSLARLHALESLHGLEKALDILEEALVRRQRILIIGDFDADGATSTALAVRALRAMGAHHVDFLVPDRFRFGYGLTPEIVAVAAERSPDVLVTVDNGISSIAGVDAARARGWRVVITDHHLPGSEWPRADAVVNPNQHGCAFPSKALAGVGVIFYVMLGLRARLRDKGWFEARGMGVLNLAVFLDLVALGTVADVVPLDANNRIMVAQGLARCRNGQCSAGLLALLEVSGRQKEKLSAADFGFALAPRLNAAGRLDDMSLGIRCLLTDDSAEALRLAQELDQLNKERRAIEGAMQEEALAVIKRMHLADEIPWGLCLYQPDWHEGVLGILASRLKDRMHRPVIAFSDGADGNIKGSARSIPGFHIRDALDALAARNPGLLLRFGGHAMAAGLSLRKQDFERFRALFDAQVRASLDDAALRGVVFTDGELAPEEATVEIAEQLRAGGPWGQGFPEPLFDNLFEVVDSKIVGERHLKLKLRWNGRASSVDAIAFNAPAEWSVRGGLQRIAYRLDINEYRGERKVQLVVEHMELPN